MPITPLPATIELSDFSGGLVTRADDAGVPPNALVAAENVLLDVVTGTVEARKGFKRVRELGTALNGYRLYAMHPYTTKGGVSYLMCVFSNDSTATADNIKIYAYNLGDGGFNRVDAGGRAWASGNGRHWGATVDGIFYGGSPNEKMYSWDGTTWNPDPGTPTFPAWIPAGNSPAPTATQRKKDFAFKAGQAVSYTYTVNAITYTEAFQARKDIRYAKWDPDVTRYKKGDRVSTTYDLNSNGAYWRSWECVEGHEPTDANKPMAGAAHAARTKENKGLWKKVQLDVPVDEDGKLNAKHWNRVPDAPKTHIAAWHGNRLFARNDAGVGGKQTLLYSRLAKVGDPDNDEKGSIGKAGDPQWDPDDWRTGGAPGAGFLPFETKDGDPITGLVSFGYYLLVFKRYSTHVIAGINPDTWTVRKLADYGTSYSKANCEHEGFIYFLSDRGFLRTDGTEVKPVPGHEKMQAWFREVVDWDNEPKDIELWSYRGHVWMTLPTNRGKDNNRVVLYEPATESFWMQNIGGRGDGESGIQTATVARSKGNDHLFFSTVNQTGAVTFASYAWSGTPHESTSTKTLGATTYTNYCINPSMNVPTKWGRPLHWTKTSDKVKSKATKHAARRGKYGVEFTNTREVGSTQEGIHIAATPPAGATVFQIFVRRGNWQKNPEKKPAVLMFRDGDYFNSPTGSKYMGEGWHKMWWNFTATGTMMTLGIVVGSGPKTIEADQCIITPGTGEQQYFDGRGGEAAGDSMYTGSERPYIMQYAHPDAKDADANWTDDEQQVTYTGVQVPWMVRTPWLTFGAMQEERRIRRLWSLVRGNGIEVGLRTFRNFDPADAGAYVDTTTGDQPVSYHEGMLPEDCHSLQLEVEGDRSPAAFLAVAADTEPRRIRFGRR